MWSSVAAFFFQCLVILRDALVVLILPADIFVGLAIIAKGFYPALTAAKQAIRETRVNLTIYILNTLILGPILVVLYALTTNFADRFSLRLISPHFWDSLPSVVVGFVAVVIGDFIGYWRHRLEHTRFLWPAHAVHHSDTNMTWLALERFHPINRVSTFIIDNSALILLGFPAYALLVYTAVKHYYGYLIHADLPWTYGRLGNVFVSPVMHRWHHSIEPSAYQTNFATVFSIFDRMFGTYRVPGMPDTLLGVESHKGKGVIAQLLYPLKPSAYGLVPRISRKAFLGPKSKDRTNTNQSTEDSVSQNGSIWT